MSLWIWNFFFFLFSLIHVLVYWDVSFHLKTFGLAAQPTRQREQSLLGTTARCGTTMDSIWIEDDDPARKQNKLFLDNAPPFVELLNSTTPVLNNKNNIQLAPLPPSSFFQNTLQNQGQGQTKNKSGIVKMFKMLSFTKDKHEATKQTRRKISTPFDFNHISHINQDVPEATRAGSAAPVSSSPQSSSHGVCFNTTSPQLSGYSPIAKNKSQGTMSNSTSINSNLFQRTASTSTMASTVSGRSRKHSSQFNHTSCIDEEQAPSEFVPNSKKQSIPNLHQHSNSSSSIENLKIFEKNQIHKQCSIDYSKKESTSCTRALDAWDTPDTRNVVRQSWIYEDLSPFVPKLHIGSQINGQSPASTVKRSNSISYSPSYHFNSPMLKEELNLFQNEMEISFNAGLEYGRINDSIHSFKRLHAAESKETDSSKLPSGINPNGPTSPIPSKSPLLPTLKQNFHSSSKQPIQQKSCSNLRDSKYTFEKRINPSNVEQSSSDSEDDTFSGTIASLRAAKYIRMSRFDNIRSYSEMVTTNEEEDGSVIEEEESPESTPKQHQIGVLLPSVLN